MSKVVYWLPRIIAVLFTAFISLFAFDVFGESQWLLAFLIHLIPSFILIVFTVIAWKNEKVGAGVFTLSGIGFSLFFHSIFIALPLFIIGALFLYSTSVKHRS